MAGLDRGPYGSTEVRVVVLARSPAVEHGITAMLEGAGFSVIQGGEVGFSDSVSAPEPVTDPDVVVIDTSGDSDDPADGLRLSEFPGVPAVVLRDTPPSASLRVRGIGRRGLPTAWLRRGAGRDEVIAAVRAVAAGLDVYDPALGDAETLPPRVPGLAGDVGGDGLSDPLTSRESEVLRALAGGLTNKAIAYDLGISEHTVKYHVGSILTKLDASGRTEAVTVAARLGLITL